MDQVRFQGALALRDSGRMEDAINEFRAMSLEAVDINEKASLMLNEVRCYCHLGRLLDAERTLNRIRQLAPNDIVVRVNADFGAACLLAQQGEFKGALIQYQAISREYSQLLQTAAYRDFREQIEHRRAIALVHLSRYRDAIPILEEERVLGGVGVEQLQEVHLHLGICYSELGEEDRAKDEFLRAVELDIKNDVEAHARYRLAILFFATGAFAQAKLHLEAILETYHAEIAGLPRQYIYEQLGRACLHLGQEGDCARYTKLAKHP